MMDSKQLDVLKKRFDFDSWNGANTLDRDVTLRSLKLSEEMLGGQRLERVRELERTEAARLLRVSVRVPKEPEALLMMDLRECESREAAHHAVLEVLGDLQAPDVQRLMQGSVGDVCFGRSKPTFLVFARGNLAVTLRNGGRKVVPVDEVAKSVDEWLIARAKDSG